MTEISVNIESRPEAAANLEQLRYLVFQGMQGRDGADGKNYGIVVDGSVDDVLMLKSVEGAYGVTSVNGKYGAVTITAAELGALTRHQDISGKQDRLTAGENITIDSSNRISASGTAAVQWEDISGDVGFTDAGSFVDSIDAVEAYFCRALGVVRFSVALTTTRINGSVSNPTSIDVFFEEGKAYKPYFMGASNVAVGVLNANHGNDRVNSARITKAYRGGVLKPALQVLTTAAPDTAETIYLAGFYYTEDIPAGGES